MSASQRVSHGFHRLGLFLAAIPLLVGGALVITSAIGKANSASAEHQKLLCAHKFFQSVPLPPQASALDKLG